MTASTASQADADRALKAKHRSMWASGDYPRLAADLLPELGEVLVQACGVSDGDRVLDIAAGSGTVAIPAARTGASVVAGDLTPELFEAGRARAAAEGVELEWREADAEALPFADGEFDVVLSAIGVMFAPHHQAAADELLRVCKPGGRIGIISWTPEGFIGQLFSTMKPYAPPPPPGASPPPKWGSEEHVLGLLGDRVTDVSMERRQLTVDHFTRPEDFRDYFKDVYGPTIAVYRSLADEPERAAALDAELAELARRMDRGQGRTVVDWEYLLLTATRKRQTVPGPR
jgi:ubiquinone/menaquinone biosynthesis C-methylase UbiE